MFSGIVVALGVQLADLDYGQCQCAVLLVVVVSVGSCQSNGHGCVIWQLTFLTMVSSNGSYTRFRQFQESYHTATVGIGTR